MLALCQKFFDHAKESFKKTAEATGDHWQVIIDDLKLKQECRNIISKNHKSFKKFLTN